MSSFFAMLSRMKYIDRWALMRDTTRENISEHSLEVAFLAHALALIGNRRLGKQLDSARCALLGMYHDTTEILTGDMPTPVKYKDDGIREAYRHIETQAAENLLSRLPDDLREEYRPFYEPREEDSYLWRIVKAADKLSALIKCMEELKAGNTEFRSAAASTHEKLTEMALPEADIFMADFLEDFGKTLDEL